MERRLKKGIVIQQVSNGSQDLTVVILEPAGPAGNAVTR